MSCNYRKKSVQIHRFSMHQDTFVCHASHHSHVSKPSHLFSLTSIQNPKPNLSIIHRSNCSSPSSSPPKQRTNRSTKWRKNFLGLFVIHTISLLDDKTIWPMLSHESITHLPKQSIFEPQVSSLPIHHFGFQHNNPIQKHTITIIPTDMLFLTPSTNSFVFPELEKRLPRS